MSGAAHDYVRACTHPQVKGPTLALFDAIAHFVPEGETTTPFIGMEKELAAQARIHRRTVVTHMGILVEIEKVKVIDGGRGRPARYQIVGLDGVQPITAAPLPLRADLQPVPPRARPALPEDTTGDLFQPAVEAAAGEQPAINLCFPITGTPRHLWSRITGWVAYLWSAITGTAQRVIGDHRWGAVPVIGDHRLAHPLGVPIDSRARAIVVENVVEEDARAREVEEFLDWFAAEYATAHNGARYTIERAADGFRIYDLLCRGRTVDRLKLMTIAMWRLTTDHVVGSDRWYIAERAPLRNIWLLHRKADFLDLEVSLTRAPGEVADPVETNVWTQVLQHLATAVNRHTFHTWFQQTVLVEDRGAVIVVAARGPKSDLFAEWIPKHYSAVVQAAVAEVRPGARVEFVAIADQRRDCG